MKLSSVSWLLAISGQACAVIENCYNCSEDLCLRAVMGYGNPLQHGKADCNSYLQTTRTPSATTVQTTKTITVTPTTRTSVTQTSRIPLTVTRTVSVAASTLRSFSTTIYNDQSATVTVTTSTTTYTRPRRDLGIRAGKSIPPYAAVCNSPEAYKTACSCVGATPSTVTVSRPTSISTTTKTVTAPVVRVTTTKGTTTISTVVATRTITSTFTTVTKQTLVATVSVTRTTTTNTVNVIQTVVVQPPAQRIGNLGEYFATDTANAAYWGGFDTPSTEDPAAYLLDGYPRLDQSDTFQYKGSRQVLTVASSRYSPTVGYTIYYDPNYATYGPANGDGHVSYFAAVSATDPTVDETAVLECTITADNRFNCIWGLTDQVADWWFCNGYLAVVEPGYDPSSFCGGVSIYTTKLDHVGWHDTT